MYCSDQRDRDVKSQKKVEISQRQEDSHEPQYLVASDDDLQLESPIPSQLATSSRFSNCILLDTAARAGSSLLSPMGCCCRLCDVISIPSTPPM